MKKSLTQVVKLVVFPQAMKVITENSQIRRKSNSSTIYLHIPYLNYIFFFFQIRGAYNTIKNYTLFQKELPNIFRAVVMALKFSLFGAVGSSVLYAVLLALGFNPFGKMAAWYVSWLGSLVAGLLPADVAAQVFGVIPSDLFLTSFSSQSIGIAIGFIFFTYILFGQLGALLAMFNLKSDLKRNKFI